MSWSPPHTGSMTSGKHVRRKPKDQHCAPERLQKVLARAGLASRREVEEWIRAGRLSVNGQPASLGIRVRPTDQIRLDGRLIRQRAPLTRGSAYLLHRSPGQPLKETGTARSEPGTARADLQDPLPPSLPPGDGTGTGALLERLPHRAGRRFVAVSPMPRIDGGLELVTSDGELAATLQRVVRGLTSEYSVRVRGELAPREREGVLRGELDSGVTLQVERCEPAGGEGSNRWYSFSAKGASGKEVRQLFERHGALVSRVLRTRLGSLSLDPHLLRGQFRELRPREIADLFQASAGIPSSSR